MKVRARSGATRCHVVCVRGCPWSRTTAGPEPPCRTRRTTSPTGTRSSLKPSNTDELYRAQHGKFAIRGAPAILARYKSQGIELVPVGDGSDVMVVTAGGQLFNDHRDAVQLPSSLLVPFILNGAVHCDVSKHRDPVDAVNLAFAVPDPIPWCLVCGGPT